MAIAQMKRAVVLLLFIAALAACAPMTCPNVEDLHPCTCRRVYIGLHVVCRDFNNTHSLLKAFRILRDYRVNHVLLHNLYLDDVLPSDLFDGLQIKELRIEKSKLRFTQVAFSGLDTSLYVLNVAQNSMIKGKEDFSFAVLTKLTDLNIKSNSLGKVENNWLNDKVPNVQEIVLDEDEITEVEDGAFAQLHQLKTLSMADNRIKAVKRSMFPRPATVLHRIDLSLNEIRILPHDMFFDMPSLKEIILSGNDLQALDEKTWLPVWEKLTQVLLFENKLICDKEVEWIKRFRKPYQLEGNCVGPTAMSGKSIKDIYNT